MLLREKNKVQNYIMCFFCVRWDKETYGARDREISSYLCVGGSWNGWDLIFLKFIYLFGCWILVVACGCFLTTSL